MKSYFLAFNFLRLACYPLSFFRSPGLHPLFLKNVVPFLPHFSLAVLFYQDLAAPLSVGAKHILSCRFYYVKHSANRIMIFIRKFFIILAALKDKVNLYLR